jgi:hypothetical protein
MNEQELTRRQAVRRLMKFLAVAIGTGSLKAGLSAQLTTRKVDLGRIADVKAVDPMAKAVKVLLFPRDEVFLSELGRLPTGLIGQAQDRCEVFITSKTGCNGQDCPSMKSCGVNSCSDQRCGKFGGCDRNGCTRQTSLINAPDLFSTAVLNQIQRDPFIVALSKALNVTTTEGLSAELRRLFFN